MMRTDSRKTVSICAAGRYSHIETDEDLEPIRNEKACKALIKKMKG
jgi:hypothetical protein